MSTTGLPAPIDYGVDRKTLRTAKKAFLAVNATRLERVRSVLPERQRVVLDVLPILFHINHPMLPGYVSHQTPAGVIGYEPSRNEVDRAKGLARSFSYQRQGTASRRIQGVYLMGSTGTIAHSDGSDLDVWICYPESLDTESLRLLARKTAIVSEWAASLGVEAHLFLMSGEKFRSGQRESLTGENCGTAQHYLLLDEFYRTGILLAGNHPIWWLVPPGQEHHYDDYARTLLDKRFIRGGQTLDFGGISRIPAGEFVGGGIWQLYKAIESPYKSVLKLLLTEVYASDAPDTVTLSAQYKEAIYHGVTDADQLDPYVMVYRRLEAHLQQRGQDERLELVRRCFYYKVGKRLSRPPQRGVKSWQRVLMEKLVREWGWDRNKIEQLDARERWNINDVISERRRLVNELTSSYRFLSDFARANATSTTINAEELSILGRRLYAAFERKAGKIEIVNPGRASRVQEAELAVCRVDGMVVGGEAPWGLFPEAVAGRGEPERAPLRTGSCLSELLIWALLNGVLDESTRLSCREAIDGLRYQELSGMVKAMRQHVAALDLAMAQTHEQAFRRPAYPTHLVVFVNVAVDPMAKLHSQDMQRLSEHTDSLGYSGLRENLVLNIETVLRNSWGELVATRYQGEDALLRCLKDYLQLASTAVDGRLPELGVHCFCPSRATAIAHRVEELLGDLTECFYGGKRPRGTRYLLQVENAYHMIQHADGVTRSQSAGDTAQVLQLLGAAQRRWNPVVIDRYALRDSPLPAVCEVMQPGGITVCLQPQGDGFGLLLVDELGSFFRCALPQRREQMALQATHQFLTSVVYRQNTMALVDRSYSVDSISALRYYRIEGGRKSRFRLVPIDIDDLTRGSRFTKIQAIAKYGPDGDILFSLFCGEHELSQRRLGADFFPQAARMILSLRADREAYPFYITDLDLSAVVIDNELPLQTSHYFRYRLLLEQEINRALQEIAAASR